MKRSGDADVAAAWEAEIARRDRALDEGKVRAIPWTDVRKRLRAARVRR